MEMSFYDEEMNEPVYAKEGTHIAQMSSCSIEQKSKYFVLMITFITTTNEVFTHYHYLTEGNHFRFREFLRGLQMPEALKKQLVVDKTCLHYYHDHILQFFRTNLVNRYYRITLVNVSYKDDEGNSKTTLKLDTKCVNVVEAPKTANSDVTRITLSQIAINAQMGQPVTPAPVEYNDVPFSNPDITTNSNMPSTWSESK